MFRGWGTQIWPILGGGANLWMAKTNNHLPNPPLVSNYEWSLT